MDNLLDRRSRLAINPVRRYGSMPLTVLSSSRAPAAPSAADRAVKDDAPKLLREIVRAQDELSALSSTGIHRSVPGTGHYIQLERPAAIIRAIDDLVGRARPRRTREAPAAQAPASGTRTPPNEGAAPRGSRQAPERRR